MIERPVAYPVSLSVDTLCLSRRTCVRSRLTAKSILVEFEYVTSHTDTTNLLVIVVAGLGGSNFDYDINGIAGSRPYCHLSLLDRKQRSQEVSAKISRTRGDG